MKYKKITLSALFLSIGLVLPLITSHIKEVGNLLLPMHIPIFLCSYIVGGFYGLIIGFLCPIFRSFIFGMPSLFPLSIRMAFELATYGFFASFIYNKLKQKNIFNFYFSLIISMILGRIVWGLITEILFGILGEHLTWIAFSSYAFFNGIPGIIIQLIILPIILKICKIIK